MPDKPLYLADTPYQNADGLTEGSYLKIDGELYYRISAYDKMRPFFMSLVSPTDHWLFVSSTGGLSAGRRNEDSSLFPYYTDDQISLSAEITGSKTIIKAYNDGKISLWEPFSEYNRGAYLIHRNLYKNFLGNKVVFEEVNQDLGLTFRYSWQFSDRYGIVKRSKILNTGSDNITIDLIDGLQNIMPYGIGADFQLRRSNLATAYKKNELHTESGLGMFMLSSMIVDKAEPSEALKVTTVWSAGVQPQNILLSSMQLDAFRKGKALATESNVRAENGAYFIHATMDVLPGEQKSWDLVAEVNQDYGDVMALIELLKDESAIQSSLHEDIEEGSKALMQLVGKSDGLQLTGDALSVGRHYSNVLFNIMRGGIFDDQSRVEKADLLDYIETMNKAVAAHSFFEGLGDQLSYQELHALARASKDPDILRLCYEYLPLTFSRRHGDPSRPWNKFSIEVKDENGGKIRNYQGNWRDIFQNWEALGVSFPDYVLSMITKFVNASTIDGYNPYRITRSGIDWEVIEPEDPWSYIGYWGDHQIIYLLKLMEVAQAHHSADLSRLLEEETFVYANVPYRIRPYADIIANPQDTIDYDDKLAAVIDGRVNENGGDGKLVMTAGGAPLRATLTEKLLVTLMAKLYNFVPEGGIWLNTQRPEWNDANNALVGNGVSMVTLYYLRRFVAFLQGLFGSYSGKTYEVHQAVADLFHGVLGVLNDKRMLLEGAFTDSDRRDIIDQLGALGEAYRQQAYGVFDEARKLIQVGELQSFLATTLAFLDHTIAANKRTDGLYHSYNLLNLKGEEATVDHLYEMLEGQVAVLSAGVLNLQESLAVLDALKASAIYREDQYSYMLYPDRDLGTFLNRNIIPKDFITGSSLAQKLLEDGDQSVLYRDVAGNYHFNGSFNNAESLKEALDALDEDRYGELVESGYEGFLAVFEEIFNHRAFTGRSGTFFGYEGLGSIYWHMVSKLLLATQENIYWHAVDQSQKGWVGSMIDHYYEIRAGIGINKSPDLYGSFPTDPYSHTPRNKGAQQPGMTGQVKEDVLNRWAELGVRVEDGRLSFKPIFLNPKEFLEEAGTFSYFDLHGSLKDMKINVGQLAFTYCQVPVVYEQANQSSMTLVFEDGSERSDASTSLSVDDSKEIFSRSGRIVSIKVLLEER